jgi:cytoskeletal protein RodZ
MAKKSREDYEEGTADIAELGKKLKALREAQCLSYEDVANATRVRPHLLRAIEDGTIEKIAVPVYAKGFVKTYCEYLLADDLWRKYNRQFMSPDAVKMPDGGAVDINHPTPIFRRSSIIWVYVILVFAVLGAVFLLWRQQMDQEGFEHGFFLRVQDRQRQPSPDESASGDVSSARGAMSLATSLDLAAVPIPRASLSRDSSAEAASSDSAQAPIDLSWMGGDIIVTSGEPIIAPVRQRASRQELLIEITGKRTRLVVNQNGKNVTTRELTAGDKRTYYVNSDTEVRLGVGNAADVTWFGAKYTGVGSDGNPISMIFYPDGSVRVISGRSNFFGPERSVAR